MLRKEHPNRPARPSNGAPLLALRLTKREGRVAELEYAAELESAFPRRITGSNPVAPNLEIITIQSLCWFLVNQSFALRALDSQSRALAVVHLARIPAELKLSAIAVQVLLADRVKCSMKAALQ